MSELMTKALESKEGYLISFHGVEDWEWFEGSEAEAIEHATCDGRHLNYGRTGFTAVWRSFSPHI